MSVKSSPRSRRRVRLRKRLPDAPERSILDLLREIRSGSVDPQQISMEDRRTCVEHLTGEGLSVAEIAQVLKRNERTVARDRKAIQEANALSADPKLTGQLAGRLLSEAEVCISRIRRTTRDREAPPAVKVEGERSCFTILNALVARLQSLGFLPMAAQHIQAELNHRFDDLPSHEQITVEIERLAIVAQNADNPDVVQEVQTLKALAGRAQMAQGLQSLESKLPGSHHDHDTP